MKPCEHTPQQVSYHGAVLVLIPTVVCVEVNVLLPEHMYFKEVMEHTDDGIGSPTSVNCFINEVVDLMWQSLTAHSEDGTLSWGEKVHGAQGRIPVGPCQKSSEF